VGVGRSDSERIRAALAGGPSANVAIGVLFANNAPQNTGVAAPDTQISATAYRCPATLLNVEDNALGYAVNVAAHKVVSFAVELINVQLSDASTE
jgi:hypothetical protein